MFSFDDPLSLRPDYADPTSLSLGEMDNELSLDRLTELLSRPHGESIHLFDLSRQHLAAQVVSSLFEKSPRLLETLQWLDLSFNPIGGKGLARVLSHPFKALRGLRVEHVSLWRGECHLMKEIDHLGETLRHLDLRANHVTDQGIEQVAQWPMLSRLRALGLGDNSLTDASVDALIRSNQLEGGKLKALDLGFNRLTDEALARLLQAPLAASLTHLTLSHTSPRGATLQALANLPTKLIHLSLDETRCGTLAMKRLVKSAPTGALDRLEVLDLNACSIKDSGLEALLSREDLTALRTLVLSRNALTDRALVKLPTSALTTSLQHLWLDANGALSLNTILPLLDLRVFPSLQTLAINDTALSAEEYSLIQHITSGQGQRLHTWQRP